MTFCPASKCLFCDISGNYSIANICPVCFMNLERLPHCCERCALPLPQSTKTCGRCQRNSSALDRVYAACPYDRGLDSWIRRLKDGGDFSSLQLFNALLLERLQQKGFQPPDVITPIPMHPLKRLERGFNQTHLLAAKLGNSLDIEVVYDALGRKMAPDQRNLNLKDRAKNMRRVFFLQRSDLEGLRIALIDDVMTTGATLNNAAQVLKAGGALRVDAWVIARTLPR